MNKPILFLRLEGVWQSWGENARWDVRDTATEPTKSGIVGLLGCALGYSNDLLPELSRNITIKTRTEHPGYIEKDYQTIQGYFYTADKSWKYQNSKGAAVGKSLSKILEDTDATPYTIVSPRYYLAEAKFLVGVTSEDEALVIKCAEAIQNPKWNLFLGRKCCIPTRPIFENLSYDYSSLEEGLDKISNSLILS